MLILAGDPVSAACLATVLGDFPVISIGSDPSDRTRLRALREHGTAVRWTLAHRPVVAMAEALLDGDMLDRWLAALEEEEVTPRIALIVDEVAPHTAAEWLRGMLAAERTSRDISRIWVAAEWLRREPDAVATKLYGAAPVDDEDDIALPGWADLKTPELPEDLPPAIMPLLLAVHAIVSGWAATGERHEERAVLDHIGRLLDALPPTALAASGESSAAELLFWRNSALVAQSNSTALLLRAARAESEWARLGHADAAREAQAEVLAAARRELIELNAQIAVIRSEAEARLARETLRLRDEVTELTRLSAERQAAVEHLRKDRAQKIAGRDRRIEKLSAELKSLQDQIAAARPRQKNSLGFAARVTGLLRMPRSKAAARRTAQLALLQETELFDPIWYLAKNADVKTGGLDPTAHYLDFGGAEGRAPSPLFDGRAYLAHYPDVGAAGANPLIHYLEHGRLEGREIRTLAQSKRIAGASGQNPAASVDTVGKGRRRIEQAAANAADALAGAEQPWAARPLSFAVLTQGLADGAAAHGADVPAFAGETAARAWLAAMTDGANPGTGLGDPGDAVRHDLCGGRISLIDAWFDAPGRARLRLAVSVSPAAAALRISQPPSGQTAPVELGWVALREGMVVADLALPSQVHPLLIEALGAEYAVVDAMLVPFPSLWRGGIHFAEAVADAAEGPLDVALSLSRALLTKLALVRSGKTAFALSRIVIDIDSANGTEAGLARDHTSWLIRDLGIAIESTARETDHPGRAAVAAGIRHVNAPAAPRADAATMTLAANAVPMLQTLFAVQETALAPSETGILQLARGGNMPAWRLSSAEWQGLPRDWQIANHATLPGMTGSGLGGDLAIVTPRPRSEVQAMFPASGRAPLPTAPVSGVKLAVLIDCPEGAGDLVPLLVAIEALGFEAEGLLITHDADRASALGKVVPGLVLRTIAPEGETPLERLRAAANQTDTQRVLVLSETIMLHDRRLGAVLAAACDSDANVIVTPTLITEQANAKRKGLFTATAGWIAGRNGTATLQARIEDLTDLDMPALFPNAAPDLRCAMLPQALLTGTSATDEIGLGSEVRATGGTCLAVSCLTASVGEARTETYEGALDPAAGSTLLIERLLR